MPLPRKQEDISALDLKITNFLDSLEERLDQKPQKLYESKNKLNKILTEDFLMPEEDIEFLDEIEHDYYRSELEPEIIQVVFSLFLKVKRTKEKLDGIDLADSEINKQIELKLVFPL